MTTEKQRKSAEKFAANAGLKKGTSKFDSAVTKFLKNIKDSLDRPSDILLEASGLGMSTKDAIDTWLDES